MAHAIQSIDVNHDSLFSQRLRAEVVRRVTPAAWDNTVAALSQTIGSQESHFPPELARLITSHVMYNIQDRNTIANTLVATLTDVFNAFLERLPHPDDSPREQQQAWQEMSARASSPVQNQLEGDARAYHGYFERLLKPVLGQSFDDCFVGRHDQEAANDGGVKELTAGIAQLNILDQWQRGAFEHGIRACLFENIARIQDAVRASPVTARFIADELNPVVPDAMPVPAAGAAAAAAQIR